jgi:prepilin-type N-terminal cleavage/methylation domain-containing protein
MTRASRGSDGFTLIELLISIVILGIVMTSLTLALIAGVRDAPNSRDRIHGANDAKIVAAYFANDIQDGSSFGSGVVPSCGTDSQALIEIRGGDFDSTQSPTTTVIDYVLRPVGTGLAARVELHRLLCTQSGPLPLTFPLSPVIANPSTDLRIAGTLKSGSTPAVVCTNGSSPGICGATTTFVQMTYTTSDNQQYTVYGHRRVS